MTSFFWSIGFNN